MAFQNWKHNTLIETIVYSVSAQVNSYAYVFEEHNRNCCFTHSLHKAVFVQMGYVRYNYVFLLGTDRHWWGQTYVQMVYKVWRVKMNGALSGLLSSFNSFVFLLWGRSMHFSYGMSVGCYFILTYFHFSWKLSLFNSLW